MPHGDLKKIKLSEMTRTGSNEVKKEHLIEIFHKQKKIMDLINQKVQNIFSKEKKEIELKSFLNRRKSLN